MWRMGETTRAPREYMNPIGYRTQAGQQVAARRNSRPLISQSFEELNENFHIVCGTLDTVLEKLKYLHDQLGMGHLIMYGQESRMSHDATMSTSVSSAKRCFRSSRTGSRPATKEENWVPELHDYQDQACAGVYRRPGTSVAFLQPIPKREVE